MNRQTLGITLDGDLLAALRDLARKKGLTLHDAARVALKLGVELIARPQPATSRQPGLPGVPR